MCRQGGCVLMGCASGQLARRLPAVRSPRAYPCDAPRGPPDPDGCRLGRAAPGVRRRGRHGVSGRPASGYRMLPHTADVVVEAWAPTKPACLAKAVRGLVAVDGVVPVGVQVEPTPDGRLRGRFDVAPVEPAIVIGPVPKAIAWHQLSFALEETGWVCRATIDV